MDDLNYANKKQASACNVLSRIPENLQHYWFRGLFDGDGYFLRREDNTYKITITSTYEQDWTYIENLAKKLKIKYSIYKHSYKNKKDKINKRSIFTIMNKSGVCSFLNYIFQDKEKDGIGLSRKYLKWIDAKKYI